MGAPPGAPPPAQARAPGPMMDEGAVSELRLESVDAKLAPKKRASRWPLFVMFLILFLVALAIWFSSR
jgi:hypothetical protein